MCGDVKLIRDACDASGYCVTADAGDHRRFSQADRRGRLQQLRASASSRLSIKCITLPLQHQMFVPNAPLPSISPSGHARCSVFGFCSGCCAAAHRRLDTRRHSAPSVRPHTPSYIPIHITRCMYPRLQNVVATAFLGTPLNLPEVVQRLDNIE